MTPQVEAFGRLLEQQGGHLLRLARCRLPQAARARLDPADIVQETLLRAHRCWDQFRGDPANEPQLCGWLRTILTNVLAEALRRIGGRPGEVEESSRILEKFLAVDHSTPSQRAARAEQLARLATALVELPEDQRQAVQLHHLEGHALAEVGRRMGRSKEAVAGLLFRGLRRLRDRLLER
jgi:RNA polymerase sigma-70 factor (ECF subfamily)